MAERNFCNNDAAISFAAVVNDLSRRQREALILLCLDKTREQIAISMKISLSRVDQQLSRIRKRLRVATNHGAVAVALGIKL